MEDLSMKWVMAQLKITCQSVYIRYCSVMYISNIKQLDEFERYLQEVRALIVVLKPVKVGGAKGGRKEDVMGMYING